MPKYNPTHRITRNFAFDRQYKKGEECYLTEEVAEFSEGLCSVRIAPSPVKKKKVEDA